MLRFLRPAAHQPLVAAISIDPIYKQYRLKVFLGIFVGYAAYYLLRKNFSLAIPELLKLGFSKGELGVAFSAISLSYGISKFVMGNVSDRSNAKYFLPLGLILSAMTMAFMGLTPWATSSIAIMYVMLFINGWFQGMGWPPSGRVMVHWFSLRERGTRMGIWNVAHNIGGGLIGPLAIAGLIIFSDWRSVFYFPAIIASFIALIAFWLISDTPQSKGLPSIEEYKNDYPLVVVDNPEVELTSKEIFLKYVLPNKYLWYISFANIFVYMIRYGVIDWAPTYLSEAKGFSTSESSWAYFAYEYAGIPGTLLCGYLSDKVFNGNRALVSIIYLVLVIVALLVYWLTPAGYFWIDNLALISIGFLIYGPVMLIGVQALDMVNKKAAGTAAGLTGMLGYLGGALTANIVIGYVVDFYGWDGGFVLLLLAGFLAIFFTALTLKQHKPIQCEKVSIL